MLQPVQLFKILSDETRLAIVMLLRESGEIFDLRGGSELATRLTSLEHKWAEAGASGVDCRSESGTTSADDDDLFHES